ncbi:MAG: ferrous iron transport protein B [Spirochaetes bacterium GWB1_36_13]|nr:MAG: ferrous iron transport protein B [Spirochaetes bacterium GWB1_36_13]
MGMGEKKVLFRIAIAGNPNVGKTSLFNWLTHSNFQVGNWPGVTVEKKTGILNIGQEQYEIIDLPGIYSLSAHSTDERVARDFILQEKEGPDLILNLIDASNLERNLYMTLQLIEMQVPMLIVLSMMDIAENRKITIDQEALSEFLKIPVVCVNPGKKKGLEEIKEQISLSVSKKNIPPLLDYGKELESTAKTIEKLKKESLEKNFHLPQWASLKVLEKDEIVYHFYQQDKEIQAIIDEFEKSTGEESDIYLAEKRYEVIGKIASYSQKKEIENYRSHSEKADKIILHKYFGIPIFVLIMWMMFKIAVDFGGAFIDFFDQFFGTIFTGALGELLSGFPWAKVFFADGIGGGIQTVSTFIPAIFMLFFILSLIEDSGYMTRAAFVIDRFMRLIGLPGKAFMPLLLGFGCTVPAVLATRTLEDQDDRKITIMMNPLISCGARLPVYTLLASIFFPDKMGSITFSLYFTGIVLAVFTGFFFKKIILKKIHLSPFVMELPPYHLPRFGISLKSAWIRTYAFLKRAGLMIILLVIFLQILGNIQWNLDDQKDFESFSKNSLIGAVGTVFTYPLRPLGIQEENWPATVGLFTGLFAKEAIIGTLETSFKAMRKEKNIENPLPFDFKEGVFNAFKTIPKNLIGFYDENGKWQSGLLTRLNFYIPFYDFFSGIKEEPSEFSEREKLKEAFEDKTIHDPEKRKKTSGASAYAYLLFILIYVPCIAVLSTVKKELGTKWMWIQIGYLLTLAYGISALFFQTARWIING